MRVIGTAGHVDHGKSTLVKALSGIDPDRLKEEKARGMTIDLGFAWVDLHLHTSVQVESRSEPDITPAARGHADPAVAAGSAAADGGIVDVGIVAAGIVDAGIVAAGIVDVPGHIDFIKNMLAGVGGIDAALLVIAADEGIMPQTREHLAILDLLDVPACVVAMTKVDLVDDPEWLDLVELDIEELLQGTRYGSDSMSAPVVRVSAQSGQGLAELRRALGSVLQELAPRRNRNRPRLPVDRVFTMSGFGAVVTGTLLDGDLSVGDELAILPAGRSVRIRGMQSHNRAIDHAGPGSRVALNLSGVAAREIRRGDVVARPETLTPTLMVDVSFRLLASARRPLRHNQQVDVFWGTSEARATVRLIGVEAMEPGGEGWLQLRLATPLIAVAGDRFILRRPSPSETIGGGIVLDAQPGRRWKRFDAKVTARFSQLARGAPDELILDAAARFPLVDANKLVEIAGLDAQIGEQVVGALVDAGALVTLTVGNRDQLASRAWTQHAAETARAHVGDYHATWPLRRGMPQGELRARLGESLDVDIDARTMASLAASWERAGMTQTDGSLLGLAGYTPTLTATQARRHARLLAAFAAAPLAPPNEVDALKLLDQDAELIAWLLDTRTLARLGQGVLLQTDVLETVIEQIVGLFARKPALMLAEVRDHLGTSRRVVQAILEEMDARRITRRDGDVRTLRTAPSHPPHADSLHSDSPYSDSTTL